MPFRSIALLLAVVLPTSVLAAPAPRPKAKVPVEKDVQARGRTVLLGTWTWKIAGNELGSRAGADVWWEQVSNKERNLVPRGGASWVLLEGKSFKKVGLQDLKKASYSTGKLSGASLRPGTVLAIRTRDGKFAKLKVVRYRELHDVSFPEAKHLPPGWIRFARSRPNTKEYHLELDWVLFKDK